MDYYRGKPIRYMQKCLRKLSYYYPIYRVMPTGVFDDNTRRAVIDFERHFNLKVTGLITNELYEKINKEYNNIINNYCSDKVEDNFKFVGGETSDIIGLFQVLSNFLSCQFSNVKRLNVTNIMDENTIDMVKTIQDIFNLNVTGILTKTELKCLFDTIKG